MRYPVKITKDGDGFLAIFPDIPEAITGAETRGETLMLAQAALITAFEFYFEDEREIPSPSKPQHGWDTVHVPASICAKVLVLNNMLRENVSQSELARCMGTSKQEMQRIINLHHNTNIDQLDNALTALGKDLQIGVVVWQKRHKKSL